MKYPEAFLTALLDKADITDLVSEYVVLKNAGRGLVGLCPFHREKSPSFSVSPDKQLYYCFGCQAGGNAINFIMGAEKLDFPEAVLYLANKYNMPLPEDSGAPAGFSHKVKTRLYEANRAAARFFYDVLYTPEGKEGLSYLYGRGLTDAVIRRFGLGFAPADWGAGASHLQKLGFTKDELLLAGLAKRGESGLRDVFRNRIMFPIILPSGEVAAFSGRVLDQSKPKYLNTAESPLFNKHRVLYALNLQKKSKSGRALLVEGQMDVVALAQAGVDFAVASLGTAFSRDHVRLLKRSATEVCIAFDGDTAGQNATKKAIDAFTAENTPVRVVALPLGEDPDEFVRKHGKEDFLTLLSGARAALAYLLDNEGAKSDLQTEEGKATYALAACRLVQAYAKDSIETELYIKRVHRETGFSMDALYRSLQEGKPGELAARILQAPAAPPPSVPEAAAALELSAVSALLFTPALRKTETAAKLLPLLTEELSVALYTAAMKADKRLTKEELFVLFGDNKQHASRLGALFMKEPEPQDAPQFFQDAFTRLEKNSLLRRREELSGRLARYEAHEQSLTNEELQALILEIGRLNKDIARYNG